MKPLLIFGPLSFPLFGLFVALGFVAGSFYLWRQTRTQGFNEEKVTDIFLLSIFAGLVGARAVEVYLHPEIFGLDFGRWLLFTRYPGLSLAGGLLFGLITLILLSRSNKFEVWKILDLFVVPLSLADIFAYLGCFFNACYPAFFVYAPLIISGIYLLIFAGLRFIRQAVRKSPDWATLFDRPGILLIFYLLSTAIINIVLAKPTGGALYYFWLIVFAIGLVVLFVRYRTMARRLLRFMIQFPPSVLTQIKRYLEDRKRSTEHKLADLKKEDPFDDKDRSLGDAAEDTEAHAKAGHERVQALTAQLNSVLIETRKALTKIKIGKYGVCENCGKMIDTDRLAAMPTATLCIACEKKQERK